jgi:hypothetical protein
MGIRLAGALWRYLYALPGISTNWRRRNPAVRSSESSPVSCRDQKEGQYSQSAGDDQPASEELSPNGASPAYGKNQGDETRGKRPPTAPDLKRAEVSREELKVEGGKVPGKCACQNWPTQPFVAAVWTLLKRLNQQTGDEEW